MHVLVTGGTGTVGSHVVRELAKQNLDVSVLTRDPGKTRLLPPRVKTVGGNLQSPATVRSVFNNVDVVLLIAAVSQTESHEALLAVCGMKLARVKRVVYISVLQADKAAWLPHFGAKAGIEEGIRRSGIPYTILRPGHFYQNDYYSRDALLQAGIYPQPIGDAGITRIDVRDLAEVAATCLVNSGHEGRTFELGAPDPQTGSSTAAAWSRALGREIKYGGNDLEAWEQQSLKHMPDFIVFDYKLMFEYLQTGAMTISKEAVMEQTRLLDHPARTFEAFAKETAAVWT